MVSILTRHQHFDPICISDIDNITNGTLKSSGLDMWKRVKDKYPFKLIILVERC